MISSANILRRPLQAINLVKYKSLLACRRLPRRKARTFEPAFRFPAQGLHPAGSLRSIAESGLRKLVGCCRDHRAGSRYDDSPHGLAFPVRPSSLSPQRVWGNRGRRHPPSVGGRPRTCGEAIQHCGVGFHSGQEISGLLHCRRDTATSPDPAIHFTGDCRGLAANDRSHEMSEFHGARKPG